MGKPAMATKEPVQARFQMPAYTWTFFFFWTTGTKIQDTLNKTTLLVGHNIKFDLMWLLEAGFKYTGKVYDTMIGEYILNKGVRKSLTLQMCCQLKVIEGITNINSNFLQQM